MRGHNDVQHHRSRSYALELTALRISILLVVDLRIGDGAMGFFGGGPSAKEENWSGLANASRPSGLSIPGPSLDTLLGGGVMGVRLAVDETRRRPGDGRGESARRGLGGAMIPCEESRRGLGRRRGRESIGKVSYNVLNRDARVFTGGTGWMAFVGELGAELGTPIG